MAALSAARVRMISGTPVSASVKLAPSQTVYQGGGVMFAATGAVPAADTASCYLAGIAQSTVTSAASGDYYVGVDFGHVECNLTFGAANASIATCGLRVCWTDDQTVDVIGTTTNDVPAGIVVNVRSASRVDVLIIGHGDNW